MMHKKQYDILIITHMPAFYKVNLYNKLSLNKQLLVVFIGGGSLIREDDFTKNKSNFDFIILNHTSFEKRSVIRSSIKLLKILFFEQYNYILLNGWELPEFWISAILGKKKKGIAIESSIFESKLAGIKKMAKRMFLTFINFALPSGTPHLELLKSLKFTKPSFKVNGVGIPAQVTCPIKEKATEIKRFMYVGRLSGEKNLELLIHAFNQLPHLNLSILGSGPMENALKAQALSNIKFFGYVDNNQLDKVYQEHQVMVLPSLSEPWGLVIEEALQNGLPVIVSDKVGCRIDIVEAYNAGKVFNHNSSQELIEVITEICNPDVYLRLEQNVKNIAFKNIYNHQIDAYSLDWLGMKPGNNE